MSQEKSTRLIPAEKLFSFVENVLAAVGVPREDASIVADCLLTANLSGIDTHGVVRLAHYVRRLQNGTIKTKPQLKFERVAPSLGIMDGDDGLGHVVMYNACTHAMELAEESGSGAVVVKNSSHFGMTGFYIMRIVSEGYAGMAMTATDAFLIPFGGRKPFFGTNPIAFGFPTDGIPVILDMATTSIPYGKIALAKTEGKPIPPDWGFDEEGNPTTDPNRIAGLHPIAGPKGSGLAMIIDIFSSVLSGMPWGPHINKMYTELDKPRKLGHFVWVLDIKRFMPLEEFKRRLGEMLRELNAMPPADGFDFVYYPGQIEGKRREKRRQEGIPIDPGLYQELEELGKRLNVPFPG
ncbi:MAG: Ldh family oxidoreductase [Anaerolineae bacterium]|nr:Ldh family oxidoreductase [Anaerolineae bacterium]